MARDLRCAPVPRRRSSGLCLWVVLLGAASACREPLPEQVAGDVPALAPSAVSTVPTAWLDEETNCLEELQAALLQPPLAGAPSFEAKRAQILGRAKGEPSLLIRSPQASASLSPKAKRFREKLEQASAQAYELFRSYSSIVSSKPVARETLLTEGYLYADQPSLAFGLSHVVRLEHLFFENRLWIQRGSTLIEVERTKRDDGEYQYVEVGTGDPPRRATLRFLDRVASSRAELGEPLHRDLLPLRERLGFDSTSVRHISAEHLVLDAHYGALSVPTLVTNEDIVVQLRCEAIAPNIREELLRSRKERLQTRALRGQVKNAIDEQIDEALPFDEPRTEVGQEDGKLREAWHEAYFRRRTRYSYNGDNYYVFGAGGRPRVPQVCIDFIADTFERASGSWFAPRGQPPARTQGGIDFDQMDLGSRRRVADFVDFADRHPQWFDVWRPEHWVPLENRTRFYDFVSRHREQLQLGDVVVIYGLRDDGEPHYHSFFVYETDPVSGMPIQLASNAVKPQVRSWEGEMHNAPKRSIRVRIRPRASWLASVLDGGRRAVPLSETRSVSSE